ncbi:hypothetical protein SAMN04487947_1264 [Halogeometricum rufum]|jgi:hypothetical protein|uniref:Uncharacterized protein n=1 Tax=Halogeometricum rufum TaxID=553469 RepID=A0A1I6GJN7_9EURY|nr:MULTISPECIES: hypothetical protein [Halogeometricum]MUV58170.1 hypothetical protein [Halogeometricum sp. CBA1124]SFR42412.1 hypothetical protein SAMN04487947_1264 [Halogeometricum rufum]
MSIDARQTAVGTSLLLASSVLFLTTGVDGRVSVLLAATAVAAGALALVRLLGSADGRAA